MVKFGSTWRLRTNEYQIEGDCVRFFFSDKSGNRREESFVVDKEDFDKVRAYQWCFQRKKYAYNTKVGLLHRFLMEPEEGFFVDHADRNGLNNRRCNLRVCSPTQNLANSKIPRSNTTGFKGVYSTSNSTTNRKPFLAKIQFKKKHLHIGYYNTAEEAAKAYDAKARELFGEFAKPNF